jgi:hypothetical protein
MSYFYGIPRRIAFTVRSDEAKSLLLEALARFIEAPFGVTIAANWDDGFYRITCFLDEEEMAVLSDMLEGYLHEDGTSIDWDDELRKLQEETDE